MKNIIALLFLAISAQAATAATIEQINPAMSQTLGAALFGNRPTVTIGASSKSFSADIGRVMNDAATCREKPLNQTNILFAFNGKESDFSEAVTNEVINCGNSPAVVCHFEFTDTGPVEHAVNIVRGNAPALPATVFKGC